MAALKLQKSIRQFLAYPNGLLCCLPLLVAATMCGCGGADAPPASISKQPEAKQQAKPPVAVQTAPARPTTTNSSDFVASNTTGGNATPAPAGLPEFKSFYSEEEKGRLANDTVVLLQTTAGDIKIKLNKQKAPVTVSNFVDNYVATGFYKQLVFHYVEKNFMVAAGGFDKDYKPRNTRPPVMNESYNGLKNLRGTVGMIRDPGFDKSATSQFYINLQDNKDLDYVSPEKAGYCVFGQVIEGMDVVDKIANSAVKNREGFPNSPVQPLEILSCQAID